MKKYLDPNKTERNRKRIAFHRYGRARRTWHTGELIAYHNLDKKENGKYVHKDWEVAQTMKTTLAAVQCLRRKQNLIEKIKQKWPWPMRPDEELDFLSHGEENLRRALSRLVALDK